MYEINLANELLYLYIVMGLSRSIPLGLNLLLKLLFVSVILLFQILDPIREPSWSLHHTLSLGLSLICLQTLSSEICQLTLIFIYVIASSPSLQSTLCYQPTALFTLEPSGGLISKSEFKV